MPYSFKTRLELIAHNYNPAMQVLVPIRNRHRLRQAILAVHQAFGEISSTLNNSPAKRHQYHPKLLKSLIN